MQLHHSKSASSESAGNSAELNRAPIEVLSDEVWVDPLFMDQPQDQSRERSHNQASNHADQPAGAGSRITLSPAAAGHLRSLNSRREQPLRLRVTVEGGGCSGYRYRFSTEGRNQPINDVQDAAFSNEEELVVIDHQSLTFVAGSTVDWEEDLTGTRFRLNNPQVRSGCGCGTSFSV